MAAAATLQQGDTPRSWADLPLDLAAAVLRRLPPRPLDRVRFGAVCAQWRAAARENPAMPPHFPWLALPDRTFYSLPDSAFRPLLVHLDGHRQLPHAQSSCGEWLVFERQDGAITLMSPFSGATMVLPGHHTLPRRGDDEEPFKVGYDVQGPPIRKLVVWLDNLVAAAVVGDGNVNLALCRPGAGSWSWALVDGAKVAARDIVLYQGQLYTFSGPSSMRGGRRLSTVSIADDDEPAVSEVRCVIPGLMTERPPYSQHYLLESRGALLMITKKDEYSSGDLDPAAAKFVVYVANFERSRWTVAQGETQLLGEVSDDRVIILGPWCSRSIAVGTPAQRLSVGGSSIVFFYDRNGGLNRFRRKRLPFFCGVYDIKTRRSHSLLQTSVSPLKGFETISWLFPTS
ncbi:unnamed protein product [Alopecurus aequalis]